MDSGNDFPVERRRYRRHAMETTLQGIRLDPDGGDVVDTFRTRDVSHNGLGAMTERAFYPGQRVVLTMEPESGPGRRNIYATIVRCRSAQSGYRIGMQFDSVTTDAWHGVASDTVAA